MSVADHTTALYNIAQLYLGLGWSVIPVWDNKVAAIEWKPYQTRRPTETNLQTWFTGKHYPGLAIVTGMISNLAVLDFDDPQLFQQFKTGFSHLAETRTVQTGRGYHLYFQFAPGVRLSSRKTPGVDLQSDGRYVVAPPSIISGHQYTVVRGGQPKMLTAYDVGLIQAFLDSLATNTPETVENDRKESFQAIKRESCKQPLKSSSNCLTTHDLIGLYRYLAPQQGRNEALFKASLRARDSGMSLQQTISALADVHITQPAMGPHKAETPAHRYAEAERTIQSAFSRPPRPYTQIEPDQLPNTVREALFQQQQTYTVRVIEGLRLAGLQPGQWFTEAQARHLLQDIVGHHSIRQALTALTSEGERLFIRQKTPSGHPLAPKGAATNTKTEPISKCFEITPSKSKLIPAGRSTYAYQLPGNLELAQKLEVTVTRISDPITEEDLQSAKKTRQAAHREYIRRRPDHYPCTWLASRLGVSILTEQRYNQQIPITVVPTYTMTPIFFWNLHKIPDDLDIPGLCLQDETGKRYPARQPIAQKLLRKNSRVTLLRRGVNYYCYSQPPIAKPGFRLDQQVEQRQTQIIPRDYVLLQVVGQGEKSPQKPCSIQPKKTILSSPVVPTERGPMQSGITKRRVSKRFYRKPLADSQQEALAQRLYNLVQALCCTNSISQETARRLVDHYDTNLVEKALKRIGRDQRITNPAGFVVTYLRSESKREDSLFRHHLH